MAKFELTIHGETGAELTEGVADLMDQFGGTVTTGGAKAATPKATKPAPEPDDSGADDEGDAEITIDDVKDAAQRLIAALDNDQERAQALVKEKWGIKQISKLAKKRHAPFVEWAEEQIRQIAEVTGEGDEGDDD